MQALGTISEADFGLEEGVLAGGVGWAGERAAAGVKRGTVLLVHGGRGAGHEGDDYIIMHPAESQNITIYITFISPAKLVE